MAVEYSYYKANPTYFYVGDAFKELYTMRINDAIKPISMHILNEQQYTEYEWKLILNPTIVMSDPIQWKKYYAVDILEEPCIIGINNKSVILTSGHTSEKNFTKDIRYLFDGPLSNGILSIMIKQLNHNAESFGTINWC